MQYSEKLLAVSLPKMVQNDHLSMENFRLYECGIEIEIRYRSKNIIHLMIFIFFVERTFGRLQNGKQQN